MAAEGGHVNIVEYLVGKNPDINSKENTEVGYTTEGSLLGITLS